MKIQSYAITRFLQISFLLIIVAGIVSCKSVVSPPQNENGDETGGSDNGSQPTVSEQLDTAWTGYTNGSYQDARDAFQAILDQDATQGEAHDGLAWCLMHLDDLDQAAEHIKLALSNGYAEPDIYILSAAIQLTDKHYQQVLSTLQNINDLDTDWSFEHDESVTYRDMLLLRAFANFHDGNFTEVSATLRELLPDLEISKDDPETWVYKTKRYADYRSLLLAILEDQEQLK